MTLRLISLGALSLTCALAAAPAVADSTVPVYPGAHLDARHSTPLNALYETTAPAAKVVAWYRSHLAGHQVQADGSRSSYYSITHFIEPASGDIDVDVMDMKPGFAPTRTTIRFNKHG